MTCSRFSLLKTLLMTTEANCPCSGYVLSHLSMAGFNPIIYGRFWVITEVVLIAGYGDAADGVLVAHHNFAELDEFFNVRQG
jgi:hypothetical protein